MILANAEIANPAAHYQNQEAEQEDQLCRWEDEAKTGADRDPDQTGDRKYDSQAEIDLALAYAPKQQKEGDNRDSKRIGAKRHMAMQAAEIQEHGQPDDRTPGTKQTKRQAG